jgi:hypothetical protein
MMMLDGESLGEICNHGHSTAHWSHRDPPHLPSRSCLSGHIHDLLMGPLMENMLFDEVERPRSMLGHRSSQRLQRSVSKG